MTFVSTGHEQHLGKVIGTGHCVPFVQHVANAPHTSKWKRGQEVRGNDIPPGTAIATFNGDGTYGNHTDGRSHAAILLETRPEGLLVADQWVGQPVHQRVIRYRGGQGQPVNDGSQYFVIETADDLPATV